MPALKSQLERTNLLTRIMLHDETQYARPATKAWLCILNDLLLLIVFSLSLSNLPSSKSTPSLPKGFIIEDDLVLIQTWMNKSASSCSLHTVKPVRALGHKNRDTGRVLQQQQTAAKTRRFSFSSLCSFSSSSAVAARPGFSFVQGFPSFHWNYA